MKIASLATFWSGKAPTIISQRSELPTVQAIMMKFIYSIALLLARSSHTKVGSTSQLFGDIPHGHPALLFEDGQVKATRHLVRGEAVSL
jgi:hypothetical protein